MDGYLLQICTDYRNNTLIYQYDTIYFGIFIENVSRSAINGLVGARTKNQNAGMLGG